MYINYTPRELKKHLEYHGWYILRSSKHYIYSHPKKPYNIIVPRSKTISHGVIRKILKRI